jgi:hypothetical protein
MLWSWLILCLLPPGHAFAVGITFSGTLERVGNGSLSVRLADRRVIDAALLSRPGLDSGAVAAQYRLGDQLEIACQPIQPLWEQETARYQYLEVIAIRLIRRPSPEELATLFGGVPFREGTNLLERPPAEPPTPSQGPDSNAPGGPELAHARKVNLEYAAHMPNFVADERAKRYRKGPGSSSWRDFDTVESEITFRGNHAARQGIRRSGKPWDQPFEALPGFKWYEGFGTEISPLFDPKCPTTIEFYGRSKVNGRPVLDYQFSSPVDSCFPFFFFDYQKFNPARAGHVKIDDPDGHILQLDEQASGFPPEIQFADREEHITWDYVKIGADSHLLPVRASFHVRYYDGTQYRIEVEYRNHRHFEASTNVTFH